jgi:2-hydroxyacyl-CoA lyase 1
MDIGRSILTNILPRHRLDAGTYGTMGVGLGFAIAAAMYYRHDPAKKILCIEGDSAFGFSGMEFEVAARFQLPIVFVVVNNSGIYQGLESSSLPSDRFSPEMPVTQLSLGARYDKIAEVVGDAAKGYLVKTPQELEKALKEALTLKVPSIINVIIRNQQERKPQPHSWLTTAEKKPTSKL